MPLHPSIYLDNNATTPIAPEVAEALTSYLNAGQGNPSSTHRFGQEARGLLNQARSTIANALSVRPEEICFTSGATEGMHMLIKGILDDAPHAHAITSNPEHACVDQLLKNFEKKGRAITWLSGGMQGFPNPEELEKAIRPDTKLITLMAVNNETGVRSPIEAYAQIAARHRVPMVVDAVAWLGKEEFRIPPGVAALCFSGHKVHAPAGIGFVVLRSPFKVPPLFVGGPQEFGRRAGTENMLGILGLAKAVELLQVQLKPGIERMARLRDKLERGIMEQLPFVKINGSAPRVCNTTNLAFEGVDGESLLMNLDQEGIAVSHGSACSSGALEPSRVLLNMGLPLALARTSLRFSLSRCTTEAEIDAAIDAVVRHALRLKR